MAKKAKAKKQKPAKKVIDATPVAAEVTEAGKSKRSLKKVQSVRQKAEKAGVERKPRHIKRAGSTAAIPFKFAGRMIVVALRPLRFLLWPFKNRPMRFIGRVLSAILLLGYFRGAGQELRQVKWPGRKETAKLTLAVMTFAVFFALIISLVDYGLDKVFKQFILK